MAATVLASLLHCSETAITIFRFLKPNGSRKSVRGNSHGIYLPDPSRVVGACHSFTREGGELNFIIWFKRYISIESRELFIPILLNRMTLSLTHKTEAPVPLQIFV